MIGFCRCCRSTHMSTCWISIVWEDEDGAAVLQLHVSSLISRSMTLQEDIFAAASYQPVPGRHDADSSTRLASCREVRACQDGCLNPSSCMHALAMGDFSTALGCSVAGLGVRPRHHGQSRQLFFSPTKVSSANQNNGSLPTRKSAGQTFNAGGPG